MWRSSARSTARQWAAYSSQAAGTPRSKWPALPYSSTTRWPSAPEHWSVVCLAAASSVITSAGPTAQPSRTPGANSFENVPACSTTSGPSDHNDGSERPSNETSR